MSTKNTIIIIGSVIIGGIATFCYNTNASQPIHAATPISAQVMTPSAISTEASVSTTSVVEATSCPIAAITTDKDVEKKNVTKKKIKMKKTKDYVYTVTNVYVRKQPTKKSKKITLITNRNKKIYRIGVRKDGWAVVRYHHKKRYIFNKFLSKKKVKIKKGSISFACKYSASAFRQLGEVYYNSYRWTWYSQRILPGGGLTIPGRHLDENGYVCDRDNYICLASEDLREGTIISTPFGKMGKIYDCGCPHGTIDTYVGW